MNKLVLIFAGGGAGAVCRYLLSGAVLRVAGIERPYLGIFVVNVVGGFLMGFLTGVFAHRGGGGDNQPWRWLLAVGVLGGFTTFSSFSLDAALLIEKRAYGEAGAYIAGSVALSIVALFAGLMLARRVLA